VTITCCTTAQPSEQMLSESLLIFWSYNSQNQNATSKPNGRSNYTSCSSLQNKYRTVCFPLEWNTSKFISQSEHTAKENAFLPKHVGHFEAGSPQSLSDTDTLTCTALNTELLLLSSFLWTLSGGHTQKPNSKFSKKQKDCNWKLWLCWKIPHL